MKKLYPRICSNCGRRFIGKKMDYRCPICIENVKVKIEEARQPCHRDARTGLCRIELWDHCKR